MRFILLVLVLILSPRAMAQGAFPDRNAGGFILGLIDIETTGLDPETHEMIDIGAVYADLEGREIARFFTRIRPEYPERADPGAVSVNGYSQSRWEAAGAVSPQEAVLSFIAFHEKAAAGRSVLFTAYNAWFDQAFLSRLLARHDRKFRDLFFYHILDLPSMAWGQGVTALSGGGVSAALGLPDETRDPLKHTGETGALFNLSVYRSLLARAGSVSVAPAQVTTPRSASPELR